MHSAFQVVMLLRNIFLEPFNPLTILNRLTWLLNVFIHHLCFLSFDRLWLLVVRGFVINF
jgi:hypothetical protein